MERDTVGETEGGTDGADGDKQKTQRLTARTEIVGIFSSSDSSRRPENMSCIPASHSMSLHSQVDSQLEEGAVQRRGSKAYQIFPEPNVDEETDAGAYPVDFLYRRERLPSIVVEPTEQSEERWALRLSHGHVEEEQEEQEEEQEEEQHGGPRHVDGSVEGERRDDVGSEVGAAGRKSSLVTSQSQPSLSRLTPPTSPTPPEAAPPCLRS